MKNKPIIIYEDNHLLIVEKPPNMLTQGDCTGDLDLHSYLKIYLKETYQKPGDAYLGLVHRMDRPVGGLLCFAKTSKAASRLSKQIQSKELQREYLALVEGNFTQEGKLENYLYKNTVTNKVEVVDENHPQGKKALLYYESLVNNIDNVSLVSIFLETGRAHQIRVQLSHLGYPLLGDKRYNKACQKQKTATQIALWGFSLSLQHPTQKEKMTFLSIPKGEIWLPFKNSIETLSNTYLKQGAITK